MLDEVKAIPGLLMMIKIKAEAKVCSPSAPASFIEENNERLSPQ
jgi:hypothetical protein